jgi:predicted ATPase/DNA-binding NarL/FixJ family response regulator/tetratricopeptide (TPR) repeat protein
MKTDDGCHSSEPLTKRELQILHLMAQGKTNQQIADKLFLTSHEIEESASQIYRKLDVKNRREAVDCAKVLGLLDEKPTDGCYSSEPLTKRELQILRLMAQGKTNQQIADKLFLAYHTIRWYASQIYQKLDVKNRREAVDCAEALGLLDDKTDEPQPVQNSLPIRLTSLIGREHEISEITGLLQTARLLTLSGPGGTGKTRLALAVAERIRTTYRDGVYFVNLAPLTDPSTVANAIADVLEVIENADEALEDTLKHVLQNRHCLLVLDNFEHMLESAPLVSDILQASSKLIVLVTSREILRLYGEQEYAVSPLRLPNLNQLPPLEELEKNEAIQLFAQRAQAVSRQFELTERNISTIAQICTRLDGLPLAIELAAARCKFLTPIALLSRLQNRLDTLTSGARDLPKRQQTIRNTIEWSYDLLEDGEKMLFARLSVFRGGRSLEASEAVCSDGLPIDVFDGLASLIDKNLLVSREDRLGEPRFWMLETIHEYALECLDVRGEAEAIRRKHAEYFCLLAEEAVPELERANQQKWKTRLVIEYDNLRSAMQRMLSGGDVILGVRTVTALHHLWSDDGTYQSESDHWAYQAMEYFDDLSAELQIELLILIGYNEWRIRMGFVKARQTIEQALEIARKLDDNHKYQLARTLRYMGGLLMGRPDSLEAKLPLNEAIDYCREAVILFQELGHDYLPQLAITYHAIAELHYIARDFDDARESYEKCVAIARQVDDNRRVYVNIGNLSSVAREIGDNQQASSLAKESLKLSREANDRYMMAVTLKNIANPVQEAIRATRFLSATDAALVEMGTTLQPGIVPIYRKAVALARENLSEEEFAKAWEEGSAMSLDEAVAYALDEIDKF